MSSAPVLETARLTLRPLTTADLDVAHALWTDAAVRRFLWDDVVITRATAAAALRASAADFARRGYGLWAMLPRPSRRVAGFVGLRSVAGDAAELMYGVRPAWWRRGLAVEACTAVLDHALLALGHTHVVAASDAANVASTRVMRALGMRVERRALVHGVDTVFCRLTAPAWRRQRRDRPVGTTAAAKTRR